MHDIDRVQAEYWGEAEGEYEDEEEYEGEYEDEEEYEGESEDEEEYEAEIYGEREGVFSEAEEMELAAELLEVSDEAELDQFLGKLLSVAGRAIGKAIPAPTGRLIGGVLKTVAKKTLPIAGGVIGNIVAPGIGGAVGSKLASAAGSLFGLELEGMSSEDQEFEVARRIVRLGGEAMQQASELPPAAPPLANARAALAAAAQQVAPGLLKQPLPPRPGEDEPRVPHQGIWRRVGHTIVLELR